MKEIADHDERQRDYPENVYFLVTGKEQSGRVACYRPGLKIIDFYRTSVVLVGETVKPPVDV